MPAFVWIALGVFGLCLLAGGIWATVNALRAWRRGLPAYRRLTAASASMSGRSTELERRLATLEPKTSQLRRDVARLQYLGRPGARTARLRPGGENGASPRTPLRPLTRVAAVDLGTNATRMLVADVAEARSTWSYDGSCSPVLAKASMLAGGCSQSRSRARNCLTDYRRELEELGAERTLASALVLRDAENGEAFLGEIEAELRLRDTAAVRARRGAADVSRSDGRTCDRGRR